MRDFDLELLNYRCFSEKHPLKFSVKPGFTALVGPNNSGKSTLLRAFYELRTLFQTLAEPGVQNSLFSRSPRGFGYPSVDDPAGELPTDHTTGPVIFKLAHRVDGPWDLSGIKLTAARDSMSWTGEFMHGPDHTPAPYPPEKGEVALHARGPHGVQQLNRDTFNAQLRSLGTALYIPAFRNIVSQSSGSHFDLTFGTDFVKQWDSWQVGPTREQNRLIQRVINDIATIFGFRTLSVTATPGKDTLHVVADGRNLKIRELGAGFSQFILVLGNVAIRQPDLLLIDEPELNLHPSLQAAFLTTLASYTRYAVLFATHSLGLARTVADRIYSVRHEADSSIVSPFEHTSSLAEFMGEMSFAAYRELGYDRILCVEGIADVKTAQQYLRLLGKDTQVVVIPIGGRQFIHGNCQSELEELRRLSDHISILIDSERQARDATLSPERQRFCTIARKLGYDLHVTERRAFEHYLTDRAIKRVHGDKYRALEPFEAREELQHGWNKRDNWRIAREMTRDELVTTDLGQWLQTL